jgi:hypothetical protein
MMKQKNGGMNVSADISYLDDSSLRRNLKIPKLIFSPSEEQLCARLVGALTGQGVRLYPRGTSGRKAKDLQTPPL